MSATLTPYFTPPRLPSQIMVLAWFDSYAASGVSVVALEGAEAIPPAHAYDRLFPDGGSGAARCLPWLRERNLARGGALCAYGAIVGVPPAGGKTGFESGAARIYSSATMHPTAQDRVRLKREFQAFLRKELRSPVRVAAALFTTPHERAHHVEVCVLSGQVRVDAVPIAMSDGEFGVLACIALGPGPVSGRNLAETIWPERDPDAGSKLVKVYIHRIRARVGRHDVIESTDRGYGLGPGVDVDLPYVEQRVRALNGTTRCSEPDTAVFRQSYFAFAKRGYRRLSEFDLCAALESRIELLGGDLATLLARSASVFDHERSLETADELLRTTPSCEAAVELAMRAYIAAGNRDAALSRYRSYCELLRRDLDAAPSAHLAALAAKWSASEDVHDGPAGSPLASRPSAERDGAKK